LQLENEIHLKKGDASSLTPSNMDETTKIIPVHPMLIDDLRRIINRARANVALKANEEIILMFWEIGERINREVLGNKRAAYGQQIVSQVATQLQAEFGKKGFGI
jgi:hypothetical protein